MNSYSLVEKINRLVNESVTYKTDLEQYQRPEYWIAAGTFGDCEDYALLKRAMLLEQGFDISQLHLVCCWTELGDYHCVLFAETDSGTYVLDNRSPFLVKPTFVNYKWDRAMRDGEWYVISV